ncbi:MAG: GNAT family N-acetyltransferase [Phycisphaeraceae bacterium]|nr:GNAT family N-acetyltransferase [Phycisphaeraceae bacterium]
MKYRVAGGMPAFAGRWAFFIGCKLMKRIPTIQTERLVLRPFTLGDAADVQRLAGDRAIADTTLNIPHPYADGMAEQWIAKHADWFANDQGITFAVTRKPDGSLIGAIGLTDMIKGHQAELGYWIATSCWNQGYCTEAGQAILRFGFKELGLIRIHACHIARNPASGRVMEKLGMRYEGRRRQHVQKWGKCEDLVLFGILEQEWQTTLPPPSRT